MRAILHAKFDAQVAKLSSTSDKVTGSLGLRDSSVEEFEAALTKARASSRAERDDPTAQAGSRGVGRNFGSRVQLDH